MIAHLYAGAPAPDEYVEMRLCREFHVLPSQLRAEPADNVLALLAMMAGEAAVRRQHNRSRRNR